jgi:CRP/FNR family cyclic AMP-dependent transcriptional regulator
MRSILGFCDGLPEHTAAAGEVLLQEGNSTGRIYILAEGAIEIVKGPFQVHETEEPGAVFGEISALLGIPHTATVKARTPCRLFVVDGGEAFLRAHHDISTHLAKLLAQRLYSVTTYLADLKSQFEDRKDHLGMVDEVLETLLHQQDEAFVPGSDRHPDPTI